MNKLDCCLNFSTEIVVITPLMEAYANTFYESRSFYTPY